MKTGVFIVPTGIGASIGGFAGDASRWARLLSEKCRLIVNPNVVNAACFSGITDNMLYVEGYALDEFFRGELFLTPSRRNKIGVIYDCAIKQSVMNVHINTMNAVETVYGVDICGYELTDSPAGVEFYLNENGISTGSLKNPETLLRTAKKLLNKGAEALAVVCAFPEDCDENYSQGIGADPVGGVEAIISHYISKELCIPCAHAPAFDDITISTEIVDKRCSAEYITPTFLPCILLGLSSAPKLSKSAGEISVKDIDFLIMPYNSLGCIPVLEAVKRGIKIYTVKENKTLLNVTKENFLQNCGICDTIETYKEAAELI